MGGGAKWVIQETKVIRMITLFMFTTIETIKFVITLSSS